MNKNTPTMGETAENGGITGDLRAAIATDESNRTTLGTKGEETVSYDVLMPLEGKKLIDDDDNVVATPQKPPIVEEEEIFTPSPKKIFCHDFEMKEKMFSAGKLLCLFCFYC